jgi:hypothetical protein
MDLRKAPDRPITKPKQLLVEGRTPQLFFAEFLNALHIADIEIHDFGSNEKLSPFLKAFCNRPEFKQIVTGLAIVRDAEFPPSAPDASTNPSSVERAFESVCYSLRTANQQTPSAPALFTEGKPKIGIFILPNCRDDGMLETLCFESVKTDAVIGCIDSFFDCMATATDSRPRNMPKARTFAYLATRDITDPLVGRAAQMKLWPWDSPVFAPLKDFFSQL